MTKQRKTTSSTTSPHRARTRTTQSTAPNQSGKAAATPHPLPPLRVAGVQLPVTDDLTANAAAIARAIDAAADEKAHILLTPEAALTGRTHHPDMPAVDAHLETLLARAAEHQLALALGTCYIEPAVGKSYNQLRFYDATGDFLGFHSKTLLTGDPRDPTVGEINHYAVNVMQTFTLNGIRIAGLIGNDLWADPSLTPQNDIHLSQKMASMGVRIIFHAGNTRADQGTLPDVRRDLHNANLQLRAQAGAVWIISVDNAHPLDQPTGSPSGIVAPDGRWQYQSPAHGEHLFTHTLELT